jgi:hypothetical protein
MAMHKARVALSQPRWARRSRRKDGLFSLLDLCGLHDLRGAITSGPIHLELSGEPRS